MLCSMVFVGISVKVLEILGGLLMWLIFLYRSVDVRSGKLRSDEFRSSMLLSG